MIAWPAEVISVVFALLTSVIAGAAAAGTVTEEGGDTGGVRMPGGVPVAVAVLDSEPLSMSAWVSV